MRLDDLLSSFYVLSGTIFVWVVQIYYAGAYLYPYTSPFVVSFWVGHIIAFYHICNVYGFYILAVITNTNHHQINRINRSIKRVIIPTQKEKNIAKNSSSICIDWTNKKLGRDWIFCKKCQMLVPPRSWHCKACDVCIVKRDHHCQFISNCVGYYNHKYYLCFMLHMIIASSHMLINDSYYLSHEGVSLLSLRTVLYMMFIPIKFVWSLLIFVGIPVTFPNLIPIDNPNIPWVLLADVMAITGSVLCFWILVMHALCIGTGQTPGERKHALPYEKKSLSKRMVEVFGKRWAICWIFPLPSLSPLYPIASRTRMHPGNKTNKNDTKSCVRYRTKNTDTLDSCAGYMLDI